MAEHNVYAEGDANLDALATKILALGSGVMGDAPPAPRDDNRTDRDAIERERDGELKPAEPSEEESAQEEGESTAEADAGALEYLELPGAEGEEAEKVPLAEAVDLIKQARAFKGEAQQAVIRIEDETREKVRGALEAVSQTWQTVRQQAEQTLAALPRPMQPPTSMLDPNAQDYDPHGYAVAMQRYHEDVATFQWVARAAQDAKSKQDLAAQARLEEDAAREHERVARFVPEWADPKTRADVQTRLFKSISEAYGIPQSVLDEAPFHHGLIRMAMDAIKARELPSKAPEVKKQVIERAAKVVRSSATPSRDSQGKFVNEARENLRKTGSEDALAAFILKSGLAR